MNKIFYLSTCDTCKRIIKELNINSSNFEMQDIKTQNINETELEKMKSITGSYEALFNKRARKFKEIDSSSFSDEDYKPLILEEYTFLKRPAIWIGDELFVGNSKKVVESAKTKLGE